MRAAIYARKSTEQTGVGDEARSIARQEAGARAFIASRGWMLHDQRPTLALTWPRVGANSELTRILVGMHDCGTGLAPDSFEVTADVSAFTKDYGYEFYGWRAGVMVVKSPEGTLWSALTGVAFQGPKKGQRLQRMPSMLTDWGYWLMLHPESTAYDLFDGKKYPAAPLPTTISAEARVLFYLPTNVIEDVLPGQRSAVERVCDL